MTWRLPGPPDPVGATSLTSEDVQGLIPTDVATRRELDRAELENILRGAHMGRPADVETRRAARQLRPR